MSLFYIAAVDNVIHLRKEKNKKKCIDWGFKYQTGKQVANQPDREVVDKEQDRAVVIDVADSNIRKKGDEKIDKHQGLNEQLEQMRKGKSQW